tara:strand:+ start:94 stop:942 length:849 start_codon:yes stop_codon:yes gene_type:complete
MKKMNKVLAVALALVLVTSCSKKEECVIESNTTSISLDLGMTNSFLSPVGRSAVNRNGIYDWVKDITVDVTNIATSEVNSSLFELVDDGTGVNEFTMNNVLLGSSEVEAFTSPYSVDAGHYSMVSSTITLETLKSDLPYVIYTSQSLSVDITNDNTDDISLYMSTINGRRLSKFELATGLSNNFSLNVVTTVGGVVVGDETSSQSDENVYSYWSDENSTGGEERVHTISVIHSNSGNVRATYVETETVTGSSSTSATYTVSMNDIVRLEQGFAFEWQVWNEN